MDQPQTLTDTHSVLDHFSFVFFIFGPLDLRGSGTKILSLCQNEERDILCKNHKLVAWVRAVTVNGSGSSCHYVWYCLVF